jgi:tetratricopeptide (TPR) repeat protein
MPGIETSRDLFGVVRGACSRCSAQRCVKYVKRTNEYHVKAALSAGDGRVATHAHNDASLQNCSRCGCAAAEHEVDINADARARGNDFFEAARFDEAIMAYTRAISAYAGDAKSYSNRAACYLKRVPAMPQQALHDAQHAVRLDCDYAKARTRLGSAALALGRYDDAQKAFEMALKLDSTSKAAQLGLAEVRSARVRKMSDGAKRSNVDEPKSSRASGSLAPTASAAPASPSAKAFAGDVNNACSDARACTRANDLIREAKGLIDNLERVLAMFREDVARLEAEAPPTPPSPPLAANAPEATQPRQLRVEDLNAKCATGSTTFGDDWNNDDDEETSTEDDSAHMTRLLRVAEGVESECDTEDDASAIDNDLDVDARAAETLQFFQAFAEEETSSDDDSADADAWAERWEEEQFSRRQLATSTAPVNAYKRPPKESKMNRPPGLRLESLSSLFETTQVDTARVGDDERGPCKSCDWNSCPSFARRSLWNKPVLPAISPTSKEFEPRLTQLTLGADGAFCARCGCDASTHWAREEFDKIQRKQRIDAEARASAKQTRLERVRLSAERVADAEANGECVCETTSDMLTGSERRGCQSCAECSGFRVIFRESDAMNPEVMFYCSMCGCSYDKHAICTTWQREQDFKKMQFERETKARQAAREAQSRGGAESKHFATLRVAPGASKRDIAKAYKVLALKFHPDKHANESESERKRAALNFIRVTEAFKALT